jgi:acetyltransferase
VKGIKAILSPKTVALIGATDREGSLGRATMENLLESKEIRIFPVNPHKRTILGLTGYSHITEIPEHIDLAIVLTPAGTVPMVTAECGAAGVDGMIILSTGFGEAGNDGTAREAAVVEIQKKYGMRIVGPNCLGVMRPAIGLNASFMRDIPDKGSIAFISQSGGFGRALLNWGMEAHIGFSLFASLGSTIDVDAGDLIDFLGNDHFTRSIILYLESTLGDVRKFISAAKGFARNKPIIVLKPANPVEATQPPLSHAATLAGSEAVYDAVFKRIGIVRVKEATDLFNAAGVLYTRRLPAGPRLLIITNAGGVGLMAKHTLITSGGELARLSPENMEKLDQILPSYWKRGNPVDVLRDADVARIAGTAEICLNDPGVDGVLIIYTPQGEARPDELAKTIIGIVEKAWKPVITTFMGGKDVKEGKELLHANGISTYDTPEEAVKTYLYMHQYTRNLELLYETPAELSVDKAPPKNNLKALIRRAVKEGWSILSDEQSMRFLGNYGIPCVSVPITKNVDEAIAAAKKTGYPVVLKIASPDIIYRIDVGGVETNISSDEELRTEYRKLINRVKENAPEARIEGVIVQKMLEKIDYEVILGAKKDSEFGTVIVFGMGGVGVQLFKDFSVGLPPLNQTLARRLMEETEVYRMLTGYRGKPPADLRQLEEIIVSFSNLIVDFPEIAEMDINPIAISNGKAYALDARIVIDNTSQDSPGLYPHLVITPYPVRYVTHWAMTDGTELLLRPVRPEDEPLEHEMLTTLSEETLRTRFFQAMKTITHEMHVRFCNIDYDREMAIVAELKAGDKKRIIGIGRLVVEPDFKSGEYAVLVHDDFHGRGLGYKLVDVLIGIAHDKGLEELYGYVQIGNSKMLKVCKRLGFIVDPKPDEVIKVRLPLK